jgi:putative oxidoreductase
LRRPAEQIPPYQAFGVADEKLTSTTYVRGQSIRGLLLLIGLFTRPVAFILSGEMAFAYFMAHAPRDPLPLLNGGELAVVYCFVFLYLAVAGGGEWSVDAYRQGAAA